jgi:hypothetical protein
MIAARRLSPLLRLVWATTALITVWCLGCSAFDPLLALLGGSSAPMMVCASDGAAPVAQGSAVAATASSAQTGTVAAASSPATHGDICGCQSCLAAQADRNGAQIPTQPASRLERAEPVVPASVTRSPLLPPPERLAYRA